MTEQGKGPHIAILRSPLKRMRGLGSAHFGSGAWSAERLTAIALVPLTLWFIASVIGLEGASRVGIITWLHTPVPLVLILCLIVATFWHMELGLRVGIDDYVHNDPLRIAMPLFQRGLCLVAGLFCVMAALRLGLWDGGSCNPGRSAAGSTVCGNAFSASVARRAAQVGGGTAIAFSAPPSCSRRTAGSPTAATRRPESVWTRWTTRSCCIAATRS